MPVTARLDLPPRDAIEYFSRKGMHLSWDWHETDQATHARSFTVAKVTSLDVLAAIRREVARAISEGMTFDAFKKALRPRLEAAGWWGKEEALDADTGEITQAQLGCYRRLRTIFQANVQSAYTARRYKRLLENADAAPYWQYIAVMDGRTRPAYAELHGKVWRFDDPIWNVIWPPNGFNCRCRVTVLSAKQVEDKGVTPQSTAPEDFTQDEVAINRDGDTIPTKGVKLKINDRETIFRPDPGWDGNPALSADENLQTWIEQKARAADNTLKPLYLAQARNTGKNAPAAITDAAAAEQAAERLRQATRLAKAEGDARAWVIGMGKETGREHILAYDLATGREAFRNAGEAYRVRIDPVEIAKAEARGQSLRAVHNHPDSVSLSVADLASLGHVVIQEVEALGVDGMSAYLASRGTHYARAFRSKLMARDQAGMTETLGDLRSHARTVFGKYNIPDDVRAHLLCEALAQTNVIAYTARMSPAHKRLYSHSMADKALAEMVAYLKNRL
jgi:SPP1 gp7 family putative phage head morphogenesis protein